MIQSARYLLASAAALLLGAASALAGIGVTNANPSVSENFNSMWDASASQGTLTLPDGWRIDRNLTAPRRVNAWADCSTEVMYEGGISLASNAKNGTWNWGNNDSDRAIGGLTTTVDGGTRGLSVIAELTNNDPSKIITNLTLSYNIEKYRNGDNPAGFAVQVFTSFDGVKWTPCEGALLTVFDPDAATEGASVVPISVTAVTDAALRTHIEPGKNLYVAWNISVATGTTANKAPGLAVDDIVMTATFADDDPTWVDPEEPEINPSGIYLRGDLNGWAPDDEWEFSKLTDTTFELRNCTISGAFKVADASWSSACNYGSNGSNIIMGEPYQTVAGSNDNINCGANSYPCSRVLLTIENGTATILLEPDDNAAGLTDVFMVGDFNSWNYMDRSGKLSLDAADNLFKGRVSMTPAADGLSHWRIYQKPAMAGAWGLAADATDASLSGNLVKGQKGNAASASGTYDVTFDLATGAYTLTRVSSAATDLIFNPAEAVLTPELPASVKVLSLNNSLIHYNDQSAMFNDIATAMGADAEWTKHTLLGKSLLTHWEEGDGLAGDGLPGAKMMVRSQPWSHIILQEQSSLPRTNPDTFRDNVARWVEYIRQNCPNPNAVIILPVNWAYSGDWTNFTPYNETFMANYEKVAAEFGLVICPVMSAYQTQFNDNGADGLKTWFQDDRHPTDLSTYMAACMEYGLIMRVDPTSITTAPSSISAADAAEMRSRAKAELDAYTQLIDHAASTIRYKTSVVDEFGMTLDSPVTFTVTPEGASITDDGVFTATDNGVYTVTAEAAGFTRTSTVTVASHVTDAPLVPSISLSAESADYSQNFDTMGDAAEAALPEGWRIDRTFEPRQVGVFQTADNNTMYAGGVSLPSNAKNGTWNFGPSADDRSVGGITTGVAGGTRSVNIYSHFVNSGRRTLDNIAITYDVEKYRSGNNAAGFTVKLYTSSDGRNWTEAGADFVTDFPAAASTAGSDVVPMETKNVAATLSNTLAAGCDLYLAWNISVTSGNECQGAPALAIDNFTLTAEAEAVPAYKWHIYIEDNSGYEAMGVYAHGDSEIWGAWPGQAPIDEQTINGTLYKVFGHDADTGNFQLIVNNWNRSKQLPDYPFVGGRDYYFTATPQKLILKEDSSVSEVLSDADLANLPAEYYTLQGIRVLDPTNGLYILRQGNKVSKVVIR